MMISFDKVCTVVRVGYRWFICSLRLLKRSKAINKESVDNDYNASTEIALKDIGYKEKETITVNIDSTLAYSVGFEQSIQLCFACWKIRQNLLLKHGSFPALQGCDYTVQDIPGKDNIAADYLSRVMN